MSKRKRILSLVLTLIILICLAVLGYLIWDSYTDDRKQAAILEALPHSSQESGSGVSDEDASLNAEGDAVTEGSATEEDVTTEGDAADATSGEGDTDNSSSETDADTASDASSQRVVNPYAAAFLANSDMKAWLQIPGTEIDYPVMWTPEDENYYLYRDFDGSSNKNGCLILDTDSSLAPLSTNLIIHGHNMKSGAMFGNLTDYEDEEFYQNHKNIILYTEECQRNYEVIAVFRSQVYKKSDNVFKFYKFFQADTQEEFDDFYNNIKKLSLYDTGVTASFGDSFLTLSTCVYHVTNGRFVVVARETQPGDYYQPVNE